MLLAVLTHFARMLSLSCLYISHQQFAASCPWLAGHRYAKCCEGIIILWQYRPMPAWRGN